MHVHVLDDIDGIKDLDGWVYARYTRQVTTY